MKKKILVLCGGASKERLISLDTGKQVAIELKKNNKQPLIAEDQPRTSVPPAVP